MKGIGMKNFSGYTVAAAVLAAATLAGCPKPADLQTQVLTSPNSIDGKQLYFIPSDEAPKRAGDQFYSRVVTATDLTELPVDPTGHTEVDFDGGAAETIDLGEGGVFYFGEFYSTIVVGANGTVAFGGAGGGNATIAEHFAAPQISLLPVDATNGGTVTVGNFDDSVVVTFADITIGETSDNAFQLELFKTRGIDGDIAASYPQVSTTATGIVGLSNGQLAGASEEEIEAFVGRFRSSNFNENSDNTETVPAT